MDWADEPATEQQVAQLKKLGFMIARPLSLTEAASLIRQYKKRASHSTGPPAPDVHALTFKSALAQGRQPVPPAASAFVATAPATSKAPASAPPFSGKRVIELRALEPVVPADSEAASARRLEFWLDTFREIKEMKVASAQVYELRQKYGCHFLLPSREQVQDILQALDQGMGSWDHDHPEVFYQTLELNFPLLMRRL